MVRFILKWYKGPSNIVSLFFLVVGIGGKVRDGSECQ